MKGKSTYHIAKQFSMFFLSLMEDPWGETPTTPKKNNRIKAVVYSNEQKRSKKCVLLFFLGDYENVTLPTQISVI